MKNLKKLAALALALILALQMVPAALASSSDPFSGTHWYASGINVAYTNADVEEALAFLGLFLRFVPYESWLTQKTFASLYCGIDFSSNGTFKLTLAMSQNGEIDYSTYNRVSGTWSYRNNVLYMTMNGESVPLTYWNGTLSLSAYGFGLNFDKA